MSFQLSQPLKIKLFSTTKRINCIRDDVKLAHLIMKNLKPYTIDSTTYQIIKKM